LALLYIIWDLKNYQHHKLESNIKAAICCFFY